MAQRRPLAGPRGSVPARSTPCMKRRRHAAGTARQARLALLGGGMLGVLLACAGMAAAQPVKLDADSAGCLSSGSNKAPGAPTNVKATPKDGGVVLTWSPPADGSCVDTYVVNAVDPLLRSSAPAASTSTSGLSASLAGLSNERPYAFTVTAFSQKYRSGGGAQVVATPTGRCDPDATPAAPTNLRAAPRDGGVMLCWDGVDNNACVSEYRVSAKPLAASGAPFRSSTPDQDTISRGGCANITDLANNAHYNLTVTPYSAIKGAGTPASTDVWVGSSAAMRAQNGWHCKSMPGCPPGRAGLCASSGCDAVATARMCKLDVTLLDVDYRTREITQWCSPQCPCELGAALQGGGAGGIMSGLTGSRLAGGLMSGARLGSALDQLTATTGTSTSSSSPAGSGGAFGGLSSGGWALGTGAGSAAATASPTLNGALGAMNSLTSATRENANTMATNMVTNLIDSGVVGEAIGKVAAGAVTAGVNNVMNQMFGGP